MKPKRTILHCQIEPGLAARARKQAAEEGRTLTAVVIRALERYLAAEEPKAEEDAA